MQIHSTPSSPALTNAQVCRQNADDSLEIRMPVSDPNSFGLCRSFRKRSHRCIDTKDSQTKTLHCAPALQCLSILTEHARKTRVFPGKSVWNVFHKLYLCVGCCGMHKILLSQQCEVVEEVSAGRGGRKGHGMHNIWAADSCMHVRARGSLRNWSGSCWLLKCNEAPLKGAPVTGKQGSNGKKCTVIKGEKERRPCFRVAFSI